MSYVTVGAATSLSTSSLLTTKSSLPSLQSMKNVTLQKPSVAMQKLPDGTTRLTEASSLPIVPIAAGLAVLGVLAVVLLKRG